MTHDHLTRQMEVVPMEILNLPIHIIGAGAIGSFTALSLAKMGATKISVWDFDKIEIENMNSQFYRLSDVGIPKVFALGKLVKDFTGVSIEEHNEKWDGQPFKGIVITAVDSMAVRRKVFESMDWHTSLVIDPRMAAETASLYTYNPAAIVSSEAYEKSLYSDEESVQERCTNKATIYTACMLSGLVCQTVKDFLKGEDKHRKTVLWSIGEYSFDSWPVGRHTSPVN